MVDEITLLDLRMNLDNNSQSQIDRAFASITASSKETEKALVAAGQASRQASQSLAALDNRAALQIADGFDQATSSARALHGEVVQVGDELDRLTLANQRFGQTSERVGLAGDVGAGFSGLGGAAGAVGAEGAGRALAVSGELFDATESIARVKVAFQGMPEVLRAVGNEIGIGGGGIIAGLGLMALAMSKLQKQAQEAAEAAREFVATEEEIASVIRQGNDAIKEDIANRERENAIKLDGIAAAKEQIALNEEYVNKLETVAGAFEGLFGIVGLVAKPFDSLIGSMDKTVAETRSLEDVIQDATGVISENNRAIEIYNEALEQGVFSTREAIDAERKLALERTQDEAIRNARERAQLEIDLQEKVAKGERDAVQERLDSYQSEAAALEELNSELELLNQFATDEGYKNSLQAEIDINNRRLDQINNHLIPSVNKATEAIDLNAKGFSSLAGSFDEVDSAVASTLTGFREISDKFGRVGEYTQNLAKAEQDLSAAREKSAEKIADIQRQLTERREDLLIDRERKTADALIDASNKRFEAQLDFNSDTLQIERDLARERIEVQRRFARDSVEAVGNRDVVGLLEAQRTRDDAITDARESAQEQQEVLAENYRQQLNTIDRALSQQQQTIQRNYQRQLQDAQRQAQRQVQAEQQRANAELRIKQQAYTAQLQQLNSFATGGVNQLNAFANSGVNAISAFVNGATNQLNALARASSGSTPIRQQSNGEQDVVRVLSRIFN